jgi:hypothetical protein
MRFHRLRPRHVARRPRPDAAPARGASPPGKQTRAAGKQNADRREDAPLQVTGPLDAISWLANELNDNGMQIVRAGGGATRTQFLTNVNAF